MRTDKLGDNKYFQHNIVGDNIYPDYVLIFVYAGELVVSNGEQTVMVEEGGYVFLCWSNDVTFEKKSRDGKMFKSTCLGFSQSFLCEFYDNLNKNKIPKRVKYFDTKIVKIDKNPFLDSLYVSLESYFNWEVDPIRNVLEIKLTEAVYCLLATDKKFFFCLFDSIKDKISAKKCAENLMIAPHCETMKCLETAYLKLLDGDKITGIYIEVKYKNVRNFIQMYDNQYGLSLLN